MLQDKYRSVLEFGEKLDVKNGYVREEGGKLKIGGQVPYALDRDLMWDVIKQIEGWETEVEADISFEHTDIYGYYTVQSGDTLWKISERVLGKGNRYKEIFELNTDRLDDPDKIQVGQKLKLPNRQ